jgi:Xaa-Pro dipeptidase
MGTEILADDRALRTGRRERALAQMEEHDLDVLVLGRQANVRYVSGTPQLWDRSQDRRNPPAQHVG